jgi:hypothetical protein
MPAAEQTLNQLYLHTTRRQQRRGGEPRREVAEELRQLGVPNAEEAQKPKHGETHNALTHMYTTHLKEEQRRRHPPPPDVLKKRVQEP